MADIGDRDFLISTILKEFTPKSSFKTADEAPSGDPCVEVPILFPAFAKTSGGKDYENDYEAVVLDLPNAADTAVFRVQKWTGASWSLIGVDNDPALGTYNDKGFNADRPLITTYTVDWQSVLVAHDEGIYRIRTSITSAVPAGVTDYYSDIFCLKEYSDIVANDTVRLDWTFAKVIGFGDQRVDYGDINIPGSRRIQGFFGNEKATPNTTITEYTSRAKEIISNEVEKSFQLTTGRLPGTAHRFLLDVFVTGTVTVHDFNSNNENDYKNQNVILDSDYSPDYKVGSPTVLSRVTLELKEQKLSTGKEYC